MEVVGTPFNIEFTPLCDKRTLKTIQIFSGIKKYRLHLKNLSKSDILELVFDGEQTFRIHQTMTDNYYEAEWIRSKKRKIGNLYSAKIRVLEVYD